MLVAFSCGINKILVLLADEMLTKKQKKILVYLGDNNPKCNITRLVLALASNLGCSKSAVWNNLNSLKRLFLINAGNQKNKGIPVELTETGRMLTEKLENGKIN